MENIISDKASLLDALEKLNSLPGNRMTLFVTDAEGRMTGTLTDGDIRRALLRGTALDAPAADAAHRSFKALRTSSDEDVDTLRAFRRHGINLIPRLDPQGHIVEIIDLNHTHTRLPLSAIIMAGGKGERLRPLTLDKPKPLLEIEGKAIIDYNVEALAASGISDIYVTTRYLADQIDAHFARPVAGVMVKCIEEKTPLGTIGAASLIELPHKGDSIVMNSDLITTISFEELYIKHRDSHADITIAVIPYQIAVPYAILTLDGDRVTGLAEKPSYSYYANAGIYIFGNHILHTLKPDTRTDATDLIEATIADGGHVSYYPIKGTWIDVGSPTDFRQASELMRHHNTLTSSNTL